MRIEIPKPPIDIHSRDWLLIVEWAEARLAMHRTTNENVHVDATMTSFTRGRIAELKALVALGTTPERSTNANAGDDG